MTRTFGRPPWSRLLRVLPGLLAAAFFSTLFFSLTAPVFDPDFWWHLASGRWMWQQRALMSRDPFTIPSLLDQASPSEPFP